MRKILGIMLTVFVCFDLVCLIGMIFDKNVGKNKPESENGVSAVDAVQEYETDALGNIKNENWTPVSKASVLAVGDNLIHDVIYEEAERKSGTDGEYDFSEAYSKIAPYIKAADISILNQETIISTEHDVDSYPCFNSPAELGDEMLNIGFDVFNMSTNHSLDKGAKGLVSAVNYWKSKKAITTGAYLNEKDFVIPYNEVNGIKFAYLGFTESTNGIPVPAKDEVLLVLMSDEDLLRSKIAEAKKNADIVIVNAHWGIEYDHEPDESQVEMAQKLADWGADVIIGTHPHVIQPVEFVKASDGRQVLVAYSLGNFISAQVGIDKMLGGMLTFDVERSNQTGDISITNVKFNGVVTHYAPGMVDFKVYLLPDYNASLAANHGSNVSISGFYEILEDVIDEQYLEKTEEAA